MPRALLRRAHGRIRPSLPEPAGDADHAVEQRVDAMLKGVGSLSLVVGITSPDDEAGASQVSQDGRTAYATVQFD